MRVSILVLLLRDTDLPPQNRSILNERIFGTLSVRLPNLGGFA